MESESPRRCHVDQFPPDLDKEDEVDEIDDTVPQDGQINHDEQEQLTDDEDLTSFMTQHRQMIK